MDHPYLTSDLPGIGGRVRVDPEDFFVEEVPLYPALGIGEHLYVTIEKVGLTTYEAVGKLARALGVKERDFGYAGLKDRRAVTRQVVSIRGVRAEAVLAISAPGLRVLSAKKHANKLRIGHLRGNRFRVMIRGLEVEAAVASTRAMAVLEVLSKRGVPNLFGEQRFGGRRDNHLVGKALTFHDPEAVVKRIIGDPDDSTTYPALTEARTAYRDGDVKTALGFVPPRFATERRVLRSLARRPDDFSGAVSAIGKNLLWLYVSAYQSWLFNRCLERRLDTLDRILAGDLAFKHQNGAVFRVEDANEEQVRADSFEISPSGPLFGSKMIRPEPGTEADIENAVEAEEGISPDLFDKVAPGVRPKGARRSFRFPLEDLEVREESDHLEVSFFLPRGSYATAVLRELMKVDTPELAEARIEG